jgi:cytochrome P450
MTAISRLPLVYFTIKGETWRFTGKLHAQYGPIVRIAPDEIAIASSGAWKDIYMSKPLMPKDPFSQTPPMNGAESLFTAAGEAHQRIRKTFINAFSDKALRDQFPIIDSYVSLLITRLRMEIGKNTEGKINLAKFYGYATLDIIADLTFGESFHGLEGDNEHSLIMGFFLGAKFGSVRNSLSRFHPIDKIFGWMFLRLTAKHRAQSWRVATEKISRRLEMGDLGPLRSDFITPIIPRLDETQQQGITRKELNTSGLAIVIAGCQLTTIALATSTYLLMRYPETLDRLRKEIRESFESEADITIYSTMNLPYLKAVINETLRIHHPTPISLPRVVPPEGQIIDGHWIPGGVSALQI